MSDDLYGRIKITGAGHCVGSKVVSNSELAESLGLNASWYEERTGITERRVCAPGESVLTLACGAVRAALADAGIDMKELGHETVLIHIQNGWTHLVPPTGILLSEALGLNKVRCLSIDGVCAEPINAIEIAELMLFRGSCKRVVISAAVDFLFMVDPRDRDTAGLFGAGAGALVIERSEGADSARSLSLYWETQTKHAKLGVVPILEIDRGKNDFSYRIGYYEMHGSDLARLALKEVPRAIDHVMRESGWNLNDVDHVVIHQPSAKLLELAARQLRFDIKKAIIPVRKLGNMGPASMLIAFSMGKASGTLRPGQRLLLLSFGLGFAFGAATFIL